MEALDDFRKQIHNAFESDSATIDKQVVKQQVEQYAFDWYLSVDRQMRSSSDDLLEQKDDSLAKTQRCLDLSEELHETN